MKRSCLLMIPLILWLYLLAGCSVQEVPSEPLAESIPVSEEVVSPVPSENAAPPSEVSESVSPSPEVSEEPTPQVEPYLFGQPVAESEAVDESWFEDAVFLGDSRTEGLQLFSGLRTGDFLWYKGMSVFKVDDPKYKYIEVDGQAMTMMEALALKQYGKVYIMIGINELGYASASYEEALRIMIDRVKEIQPNAVIYLQTLPPVNEQVAYQKGLGSYIKNSKVLAFNEAIYRVAWEKQVALLDVAEVYRTEVGDLAADMAVDGVHFYRQGYAAWYEYLKTHTLDPSGYAAGIPLESAIAPDVPVPPEFIPPSPEPTETVTPNPSPSPGPEPSVDPKPTEAVPVETPSPDPQPTETATPPPEETTPPVTSEPVPPESAAPSEDPAPETAEPAATDTPVPSETPAVPCQRKEVFLETNRICYFAGVPCRTAGRLLDREGVGALYAGSCPGAVGYRCFQWGHGAGGCLCCVHALRH